MEPVVGQLTSPALGLVLNVLISEDDAIDTSDLCLWVGLGNPWLGPSHTDGMTS